MNVISTDNAPKPIGPYSQAIEHEGLIFLSGQVALNPKTGNISGITIEEQTQQVMTNIKSILEAAGSDFAHVLKCTVYLADLDEFQAFNKVYGTFFGSNPPARSTVQVAKIPRNAKVEIDIVAVKILDLPT